MVPAGRPLHAAAEERDVREVGGGAGDSEEADGGGDHAAAVDAAHGEWVLGGW